MKKKKQEPEKKPPWEWFDKVVEKISKEPKLILKRRGKKHKF